ncbi:MAG: hypothetical protein QOD52_1494 [Gaiellaceae bacterium]|nr:hypothetical protein [Gaiellaceae bacterium]
MSVRSAWPPLLVAAGLVAGLVVAVFEPTLYRAETTLVIERNGRPVADASLARSFAELAKSDVVLRNVSQKLAVPVDAGRLHVRSGNGVVRLSYDGGSRVQATRVAQQVAVDFAQAAANRFASSGVQANVFDPPHSAGRVSPHILRDAALGLLAGLAAGGLAWKRLRKRSLREGGRWRISALAELVEAGAREHPDRIEDWRAYIGVLRAQANDDLLPYALDGVVREVFAPLLLPGEA